MQCSAVKCSAVQCSEVQWSAVQCSVFWDNWKRRIALKRESEWSCPSSLALYLYLYPLFMIAAEAARRDILKVEYQNNMNEVWISPGRQVDRQGKMESGVIAFWLHLHALNNDVRMLYRCKLVRIKSRHTFLLPGYFARVLFQPWWRLIFIGNMEGHKAGEDWSLGLYVRNLSAERIFLKISSPF